MNRLFVLCGLIGLAGCQDLRWENASRPDSQWAADQTSCAVSARTLSQRRLLARLSHIERWLPGPDGEAMRRRDDELARREAVDDTAFEDCMRHNGYERVAR